MTQGDSTSTNEKPGCRTACSISVGEPVRVAGEAARDEVRARGERDHQRLELAQAGPSGESFESQSGSVVGEGWPLVMPYTRLSITM